MINGCPRTRDRLDLRTDSQPAVPWEAATVLLAALTLSFTSPVANIATADVIPIVQTGVAAPDANGAFSTFGNYAFLNNSGQVAFSADLTGTAAGSSDNSGMFRGEESGVIDQVARSNQPSFDGNGTFAGFNFFFAFNDAGSIYFQSSLMGTALGSSDNSGIFRGDGTTGSVVVREDQLAPGGASVGRHSTFGLQSVNSGTVAFQGFLRDTSAGSSNDNGVWKRGASNVAVARESGSPPEGNGTFTNFSQGVAINDFNQVAFRGSLAGTSGGSSDDAGIYRGSNAFSLVKIAREGDAAPDGNGTISGLNGNLMLNNTNLVTSRVNYTGTTGGTLDDTGIIRGDGGPLTQIVREGQPVPDGNGEFQSFSTPAMNNAGQIAYAGFLRDTIGGANDDWGLFRGDGTTTDLLARKGNSAPDGSGSFSSFFDLAINEAGLVGFRAFLSSGHQGLFVADDQEVVHVIRTGESFAGSTVSALTFNLYPSSGHEGNGFNDQGQVAFIAALANGDEAVGLFTPDLHWRIAGNGDWNTDSRWTLGIAPDALYQVIIDPDAASVVTGPATAATAHSVNLGGGGATAELALQPGTNLTVDGELAIDQDGILSGAATVTGLVRVREGGQISPGGSVGTMTVDGSATWEPDGGYLWELNDDTGAAGGPVGWDLFSITGTLQVTAISGNPFEIDITSLLGAAPGDAFFDSSSNHTFRIATASGGVTGFDQSAFSLLFTNFSNPLNGGTFAIEHSGNDINLVFTAGSSSGAIPEPSTFALAFVGLSLLGKRRRRRSKFRTP